MREKFFTTKETARLLEYSHGHIVYLIRIGELEAYKWGGVWMVLAKDVRAMKRRGHLKPGRQRSTYALTS